MKCLHCLIAPPPPHGDSHTSCVAFIVFILAIVSFLLHWRSHNIPLLSILIWLALSDLIYGINSMIWNENVNLIGLPWCDITTKIKIGADIALPASILALALRVYQITWQKTRLAGLSPTPDSHHGLSLVVESGTDTIVQGHRFNIYENFGCNLAIYLSIPSNLILDIPPLIASALALIYCSLALVNFARQHHVFSQLARVSQNTDLSEPAYIRLMSLTLLLGVWNALVISSTKASTYCNGRLLPWTTWDDVHSFFWIVSTYPTAVIPREVLSGLYISWPAVPISSLFVFGFFACGTEVMERQCASARSLGQAFVGSGTRSQPASVESEDKSQSTTESAFSLISQTVGDYPRHT
ncbi:pheromone A receptor-domain-containing protein [Mycena albidolilacea]|uniref:Pheromone A receptor-domain-containing protein n=1 Tax=Mycena albidolilacea TaxID=1033008 RepID=A0AAD7E7C0_9AGAR|nr:pheromone A receptor-domain-containing protein [Mycena albidolilacea]